MNDAKQPNKFGYPTSRFQKEKRDAEYKKLFNYNSLVKTHRVYEMERIEKYRRHEDDQRIF